MCRRAAGMLCPLAIVVAAVCGLGILPRSLAQPASTPPPPVPLRVETLGPAGVASLNTHNLAAIAVLVTDARTGTPVSGLGQVAPKVDEAKRLVPQSLPAAWYLQQVHGPGTQGPILAPYALANKGRGVYVIAVAPISQRGDQMIDWERGDYLYAVHLNLRTPAGQVFVGSGLGALKVL